VLALPAITGVVPTFYLAFVFGESGGTDPTPPAPWSLVLKSTNTTGTGLYVYVAAASAVSSGPSFTVGAVGSYIGFVEGWGGAGPAAGFGVVATTDVVSEQAPAAQLFGSASSVIEIWHAYVAVSHAPTITGAGNVNSPTTRFSFFGTLGSQNTAILVADFPVVPGTTSMTGDTANWGAATASTLVTAASLVALS
jgi:hypothetical protein